MQNKARSDRIKSENTPVVYQDTKKNGMNLSLVGIRNHKNRRNSSFHGDMLITLTIREYLIKNNYFFSVFKRLLLFLTQPSLDYLHHEYNAK